MILGVRESLCVELWADARPGAGERGQTLFSLGVDYCSLVYVCKAADAALILQICISEVYECAVSAVEQMGIYARIVRTVISSKG